MRVNSCYVGVAGKRQGVRGNRQYAIGNRQYAICNMQEQGGQEATAVVAVVAVFRGIFYKSL
jgi:hypothetical protein